MSAKKVLFGPQTKLAVKNFPVSGIKMPSELIRTLACIKKHAAKTNGALKQIPKTHADAIAKAAQQIQDGKHADQFPVDIFQTGSGTSTNMNMNEVIAHLASSKSRAVHPNDDVNRCQSSNDVMPTAIQIACILMVTHELMPALRDLQKHLHSKAIEFRDVIKTARTHLMDAVPIRLGDEFDAYAALLEKSLWGLQKSIDELSVLPLGGTAAGTGLNAHPQFAKKTIAGIGKETGLALVEAKNHISAQSCPLCLLTLSSALRSTATTMGKIANDIRHMGSGPVAGLYEVQLPALQPGSSIMPGKVNPVLCESVLQVEMEVIGHDATVHAGLSKGSQFELNTAYPVIAHALISSIDHLSRVSVLFAEKCIAGIGANAGYLEYIAERNSMLVTALAPEIGYDAAARIAKEAMQSGESILEVARRETDLSDATLKKMLDVEKMC